MDDMTDSRTMRKARLDAAAEGPTCISSPSTAADLVTVAMLADISPRSQPGDRPMNAEPVTGYDARPTKTTTGSPVADIAGKQVRPRTLGRIEARTRLARARPVRGILDVDARDVSGLAWLARPAGDGKQ